MRSLTRRTFLRDSFLAAASASIAADAIASAEGIENPDGRHGMRKKKLAANLYMLEGAVNTGVLVHKEKALLFDCCDSVTPARLRSLGVNSVNMICCTQHRRPNVCGAYAFVENGAGIVAPAAERHLFEDVDAYWSDWRKRWHLYDMRPRPQVLVRPLRVSRGVSNGDTIEWEGYKIHVIETPGATDGSVSYLVEAGGTKACFSGDVLCGTGQVWDLYSMQEGFGAVGDYHGFMGSRAKVIASLRKLSSCGAQLLVPSHGAPIRDVAEATQSLDRRLNEVWRNYTAISALNHYFPTLFDELKDDPMRMAPARTMDLPNWIRRVGWTSFAVVSETGAAFLVDCGAEGVVDTLRKWIDEKTIASVEGCWVTHYHDDHVDALQSALLAFGCPITTDRHLAEIVEQPSWFFLPCISPHGTPVARATKDRDTWSWHEFRFTAYHFPGQTLYHSGLLVEGHGGKPFFAGDSFSPTGLDDYTCGNRMFLGAGRGFRRCIGLLREIQPDYILNQHQERAFAFTNDELDYMERLLAERERLIAEMTPWEDPNFAIDEWWMRTYPYQQDTCAGSVIAIDVEFTNHGTNEARVDVEPVLPAGWRWNRKRGTRSLRIPPKTDGIAAPFGPQPDRAARVWIEVAEGASPGRYVVPLRATWNGHYLGQFRHALVFVR